MKQPPSGWTPGGVSDAGRAGAEWGELSWVGTPLPTGTNLLFRVAARDENPLSEWEEAEFVGPGGTNTPGDYFESPGGEAIHGTLQGRFLRYRAYLTSDGASAETPDFSEVRITMGGSTLLPWYDRRYSYDGRGNMTGKTILSAVEETTETRIFNKLNQLVSNAVQELSGTTTWLFEGTRTETSRRNTTRWAPSRPWPGPTSGAGTTGLREWSGWTPTR